MKLILGVVFLLFSLAPTKSAPVSECPSVDGAYVTFIPDDADCSVFYMCVHGTPVARQCPGGLYFNPTLDVCDWPDHAGCQINPEECLAS